MSVDGEIVDGLYAAKYFKYCMQFDLSYITQKIDFRRVAAKSFYSKHQKQFDTLITIFNKYNIDPLKYIKFFVRKYGKSDRDIKDKLLNMQSINMYINYLQEQHKLDKVFSWFVKSAENISDACIENDCMSVTEYIRKMIQQQKLAYSYVSGQISSYWLAGIPTFKKLFKKMSQMQQVAMVDVFNNFDVYNSEINEAFLKNKHCKVNPIAFTDDLLFKKRQSKTELRRSK